MNENQPGKFGFDNLVGAIAALRGETGGMERMDRRLVLERLCRSFQTKEAVLLRRGFDKAYRQIVEGI